MTGVIKVFSKDPTSFLEEVMRELERDGIDVQGYILDHIAYQPFSLREYVQLRNDLRLIGTSISEQEIAGRPISVFALKKPIEFQGRVIDYLELPAPKKAIWEEGFWGHVEFVVPSLKTFMEKYHWLSFDIKKANDTRNPTITMRYGNVRVKFHTKKLSTVISEEKTNTTAT